MLWGYAIFFCKRLSASMARSLHLRFSLCTTSDSHPGPGGSRTAASLLWGYAIDKQHRVMAWLGPAYLSPEPFASVIRHWQSGAIMHTVPLPGMQFFDAWRIRPSLTPNPKMGEKLPSLGAEELIPEEPPNVDYGQSDQADIQHCQEHQCTRPPCNPTAHSFAHRLWR